MSRSICIINGHPDSDGAHFVPALADAYERGARAAGHTVSRIDVGALPVEFLRNAAEFATPPEEAIAAEREKIAAADHLVVIFPLWLGAMPSRLRAFFEQASRDSFFLGKAGKDSRWPAQKMKGKSAHLIVTMGMPGLAFKLVFGAHGLHAVRKGIFGISGFKPVRSTVLGGVDGAGQTGRTRILARIEQLGRRAG